MKKLKIQKKIIGVDIGTRFSGYAMTDENYRIEKIYGKNVIGIVNFDEAKTADKRRGFRTVARRLTRRKYRLSLLQELFNEEIMKKDPNFFRRLEYSDLTFEDKGSIQITERYTLFNDKKYTDVNFHAEYPTIFHLRDTLMNQSIPDVRLLYLAIRHIMKHRGHFLMEGDLTDVDKINIIPQIEILNSAIEKRNSVCHEEIADGIVKSIGTLADDEDTIQHLQTLLATKKENGVSLKGSSFSKAIENLLGKGQKSSNDLVALLDKGSKKAYQLFGSCYKGTDEIVINLDAFDEKSSEIESVLSEEDFEIVKACLEIRSWILLIRLLKREKSLSKAMIKAYETHKKDLKELKDLLSTYADEKTYQRVFGKKAEKAKREKEDTDKAKTECNYSVYIGGGTILSDGKIDRTKYADKGNSEDFYIFLKGILSTITAPEAQVTIQSILSRMETNDYMPRISSKNNSNIPYQLHLLELEKILNVAEQSGNFDFLREISDGMSVKNKILALFKFRIPYYVGPIKNYKPNDSTNKHAWATHTNPDDYSRITPWNFETKINLTQCHKDFIKRMTGKCTYLKICDTLPKCSPTNEMLVALNELNGLKINGDPIEQSLKRDIFETIYLDPDKKVGIRSIHEYLKTRGMDVSIGGYDEKLKGEMKTYKRFKKIFGEKCEKYPKAMEEIALILTIDTDSKIIARQLTERFGDILSDEEIKKIKGDRYNGWSSLSGEFIRGTLFDKDENGDSFGFFVDDEKRVDLLELLENTNIVLNQILFSREYCLQDKLLQYYQEHGLIENGNVTYADIEKLYCSPSVKKSVWQTFRTIKDICETTDSLPEKIFIECTRENNSKKKTTSRKNIMLRLYDEARSFLEEDRELTEDYDNCKQRLIDIEPDLLKKEKIFHYFLQLGKSVYSGDPISLDKLDDYDIDHIIPQSKTKDDSIDNKVLVEKIINNERKGDQYPIPQSCRQKALWEKLLKMGLMSREKFDRLSRVRPLFLEEEEKFINRQLVETAQTVLLVRDILKKWFLYVSEDGSIPEIVLVKGGNVSDFRKKYNLTKSRDVNDFHHAYDAYFNIVVGNVLNEYFNHNKKYSQGNLERNMEVKTENPKENSSEDKEEKDSDLFMKVFNRKVYSYRENGKPIWIPTYRGNKNSTLNVVKKQCQLIPNFVREVTTNKGELYNQMIKKAKKGLIPLKFSGFKSDIDKYGGYITSGTAYFWIVDSVDKKGKPVRSIESVSIYQDSLLKAGKITEEDIFRSFGLIHPRKAQIDGIPNAVLKKNSLLRFNNEYSLFLTGCTGNQITFDNANQLFVPDKINAYVKEMRIIHDKVMNATATANKETVDQQQEIECNKLLVEKRKQVERNCHKSFVVLSKEQNEEIYEFLLRKISEKPYKNIPTHASLCNIMQKGKAYFLDCDIFMQVRILLNLLVTFQCNPQKTDASLIKYCDEKGEMRVGGTSQCAIKMNKEITKHNIDLITYSRSGLREKIICINKTK